MNSLYIRTLDESDLPIVNTVHQEAFQDSTLTQLGPDIVQKYYYWNLQNSQLYYFIGAFDKGELTGFCLSGVFRDSETQFFLDNKIALVKRLLLKPWLLFNADVRGKILEGIKKIFKKQKVRQKEIINSQPLEKIGILSIAVSSKYQRMGIGNELMKHVEKFAIEQGFSYMHLTVHKDNHKAITFYERCGWGKEIAENGDWQGAMRKSLPLSH